MIEIGKDGKGDTFTITQTKRIVGIDFHKQMSLAPDDMSTLSDWISNHFIYVHPCTVFKDIKDRLAFIHSLSPNKVVYTEFNGKLLSSDMTRSEMNEKIFGKLKDRS